MSTTDLRVRRTRKLLHEAFQELALEKNLASITVRDVTRHAGVNRGTFYLHYKSKDDLLTHIFESVIDALRDESELYFKSTHELSLGDVPPFLITFFSAVRRRKEFYKQLLSYEGAPSFRDHLLLYLKESILFDLPATPPDARLGDLPDSLLAHHYALTIAEFLVWWLRQEGVPAEQMAGWCWRVISLTLPTPPSHK